MSCEDLILAEDVNTLCSEITGKYKEYGFAYSYNDIDKDSTVIEDGKVRFALKNGAVGVRVYDRSYNPFSGVTRITEQNDRYVVFHDQAILPLFVNNQINAKILNVLGSKRIVLVLEQEKTGASDEGKYPIFGLSGGLFETASARTDIVAAEVTLMDMNTGYPALFLSIDANNFTHSYLSGMTGEDGVSYINGGIVNTGDTIFYSILGSAGASATICLPDGTTQTTTTFYSVVWAGEPGIVRVLLNDKVESLVNENTGNEIISSNFDGAVEIDASATIRRIHFPNASELSATGMTSIISVLCGNATIINLSDGALSTSVIFNIISDLLKTGKEDGLLYVGGGTSATYDQLIEDYPGAAAIATALSSNGWAITFNT